MHNTSELKEPYTALFYAGHEHFIRAEFTEAIDCLNKFRNEIGRTSKKSGEKEKEEGEENGRLIKKVYQLLGEAHLELASLTKAKKFFIKADLMPQAAFCVLLDQNIREARRIYLKCPYSPAQKWGVFLCDYLDDTVRSTNFPGAISFRAFCESTIGYFIQNKLDEYIRLFLSNYREIEKFNPELRKFVGSAYLGLGYYTKSIQIFEEARRDHLKDSELCFKMAQSYMLLNQHQKAVENFRQTLKLLPGHIASIQYLKKLE